MSRNSFFSNENPTFQDSRNLNLNTNHPLIQNSQQYIYYKKYVSIHSEDRDILKYPSSSDFEIELPEDLLNVASLRLYDWCFPCNYDTFSTFFKNVTMTFKIDNPYNPNENNVSDLLAQKTFEYLFKTYDEDYTITIENGFYNPQQMATELTNKFNYAVTERIIAYFTEMSVDPNLSVAQKELYIEALSTFNSVGGYSNFIIVYNIVGIKLWYGNVCDGFVLTNETRFINSENNNSHQCPTSSNINIPYPPYEVPDYSTWGLPGYLGLNRTNARSVSDITKQDSNNISTYNSVVVPRFYYGTALNPGDNGYWLLPNPNLVGSKVHWIESPYKINIMGPSYIYMEIDGQNCIDETVPYNVSCFTQTTNQTNGIVNSALAKIPVPTTPLSQWFDKDHSPYKYYLPPAERMRKFHIRLRYHNGQLVNFGTFNYSFMLEFVLQSSQILRGSIDYLSTKIYPHM
jgi:hypothetical protein